MPKRPLELMGRRLRIVRLERKLSQRALGQLIGKSKQQVCAWEQGRSDMTVTSLVAMARVLSVDIAWLAVGGGLHTDAKKRNAES